MDTVISPVPTASTKPVRRAIRLSTFRLIVSSFVLVTLDLRLTLARFSAHPKHFLWTTLWRLGVYSDKTDSGGAEKCTSESPCRCRPQPSPSHRPQHCCPHPAGRAPGSRVIQNKH